MMRSFKKIPVLLLTLALLCSSALAADASPWASSHISSYRASVSASGRNLAVTVNVAGLARMDSIGASKIVIEYSSNGSSYSTASYYYGSDYPEMLTSGYSYAGTPITYYCSSAGYYRAVVTCYAASGSGSDSKVYTTSAVRVS